jgi:hypothetical protein
MMPPAGRLRLYSGLREAKGRVGLDSVGICTGPAILVRARAELVRAIDESKPAAGAGRPAETGEEMAARVAPEGIVEVCLCVYVSLRAFSISVRRVPTPPATRGHKVDSRTGHASLLRTLPSPPRNRKGPQGHIHTRSIRGTRRPSASLPCRLSPAGARVRAGSRSFLGANVEDRFVLEDLGRPTQRGLAARARARARARLRRVDNDDS